MTKEGPPLQERVNSSVINAIDVAISEMEQRLSGTASARERAAYAAAYRSNAVIQAEGESAV